MPTRGQLPDLVEIVAHAADNIRRAGFVAEALPQAGLEDVLVDRRGDGYPDRSSKATRQVYKENVLSAYVLIWEDGGCRVFCDGLWDKARLTRRGCDHGLLRVVHRRDAGKQRRRQHGPVTAARKEQGRWNMP